MRRPGEADRLTRKLGSERIDVVQDRPLPQHDLADDMARLDMLGEDRRETRAPGWQAARHFRVVERDPDDERRRLDLRRHDGQTAGLRVPGRDGLQHRLDLSGEDLPAKALNVISTGCPTST
jgi:hypothetical protein